MAIDQVYFLKQPEELAETVRRGGEQSAGLGGRLCSPPGSADGIRDRFYPTAGLAYADTDVSGG